MTCDVECVAAESIDEGDLIYLTDNYHYARCVNSFNQLERITNFIAITSAEAGHNVTIRPSWLGIN